MKKRLCLLSILLIVLLSSCSAIFEEEEKWIDLTVINNTNLHLKFSIIEGTTSATTSRAFYGQSHNYLKDIAGTPLKQQLLSPCGKKSDDLELDKTTYKIDKGDYYCTIFVCKSMTYTNQDDIYINQYTFSFKDNKTITIGSNGNIY